MEAKDAVTALAALAQRNRLEAFRLLVNAGPEGMPAGEVARSLDVPANTLSFHLDRLRQAGLIEVERQSRSQIYSARYDTMQDLIGYLTENCCGNRPELCAPGRSAAVCKPSKAPRKITRK